VKLDPQKKQNKNKNKKQTQNKQTNKQTGVHNGCCGLVKSFIFDPLEFQYYGFIITCI